MTRVHGLLAIAVVVLGACGAVAVGLASRTKSGDSKLAPGEPPRTDKPGRSKLVAFEIPACEGAAPAAKQPQKRAGPAVRIAAQKGLDYLAIAAGAWQKQNNCYGCHVQAVTLEAFSVGRANQYDVGRAQLDTIFEGILRLPGGAHHETGLGYSSPGAIYDTGKIFGSAALARYDQLVDNEQQKLLIEEAGKLIGLQQSSGALSTSYEAPPVAISGDIQTTALAVVAWRQAYERSADPRWLTAIANAEDYLSGVVSGWKQTPVEDIQFINYAVIGLLAASVGADEAVMVRLAGELRERQRADGGWGHGTEGSSTALTTGQTLYVLRLLGMTDSDQVIDRGQRWIIEHQRGDGSWSDGGFGKAEAMWSVLGLVSIDVLTVSVAGLTSGERLDGVQTVAVSAHDNEDGGGVVKVELFVDDVRVDGSCGAELTHELDAGALGEGPHLVDVQATNVAGKTSRRRFELFGSGVYLTRAGTRFASGSTEISARDIAPVADSHDVELEIFAANDNGEAVGESLHRKVQSGSQGSLRFIWDDAGAKSTSGKFVARLIARGRGGAELQRQDLVFVHDTAAAQHARWAEIAGDLSLDEGGAGGEEAANANAEVELVDLDGNVVARTRSTRSGTYRFKNVAPGKDYTVRIDKKGWAAPAGSVRAEAGAPAAQIDLKAKRK